MDLGIGWTGICNEALAYLGKDPIQSLEEDSPAAMRCRMLLPQAAESVLSERPWKSAAAEAVLPPLSGEQDESGDGLCYWFEVPSDCVRLIHVHAPVWRRIGDRLCSPIAPLCIRYVSMPEQPDGLGAMIKEAISYLLASRLAMPLAADASAMSTYYTLYSEALRKASLQESAGERDIIPPQVNLYESFMELSAGSSPLDSMMDRRSFIQPGIVADDVPEDTHSGTV